MRNFKKMDKDRGYVFIDLSGKNRLQDNLSYRKFLVNIWKFLLNYLEIQYNMMLQILKFLVLKYQEYH